mgnify:CR=1 FL=1
MKKLIRIFSCFFLALILFVPFNDALSWIQNSDGIQSSKNEAPVLIAANSSSPSDQSDIFAQAETLYKEKKYDDVIRMLTGEAYADPNNFELNMLLAKAQVEKCAILKEKGDVAYKTLINQPYDTVQRLDKIRAHQELYYIAAKSLLISDRPLRAINTIEKALRFAPDNTDYMLVLADAYCARADFFEKGEKGSLYSKQLRSKANDIYKQVIETKKDDEELKTRVEEKMKKLSEKIK